MLSALAGIGGKIADYVIGKQNAEDNRAQQKEFAQKGIQWRVEDAQKAGIHPLAALGANTTNFSPVTVGSDFSGIGQDVSRAMNATRTTGQRHDAVSKSVEDLKITNMGLQNELLQAQIKKINASINPAMPAFNTKWFLDGQGDAPSVDLSEKVEKPQRQSHVRTPDGYIPTDPKLSDAQTIEDRWGEWVGDIYGVRNWWHEAGKSMYKNWRRDHDNWWATEKQRRW